MPRGLWHSCLSLLPLSSVDTLSYKYRCRTVSHSSSCSIQTIIHSTRQSSTRSSKTQSTYNPVATRQQQPQPTTINVCTSEQRSQHAHANCAASNNTMTNTVTPALSPSSPQAETTLPLTAAALAAHQRTMAANPSTNSPRGVWVCGGQMYHRPTPPSDKRWNKLVKKDDLAAEIDYILRAATNANKDEGN